MIKKILIYIYFAGGGISRPASKYPRNNEVENLRSSYALWWMNIVTLCLYTFIRAKFEAWLSCLLIKNFNHTPNHARVSIFLMPSINVWVIAALTVSFWKIYQLYKETATNKGKERSIVNDWLSQNSLISKGKVTGDEVVFLCVSMFVLDEPLQNNFGTSSEIFARSLEIFGYYQTPTKNPGTLRIKMSCL